MAQSAGVPFLCRTPAGRKGFLYLVARAPQRRRRSNSPSSGGAPPRKGVEWGVRKPIPPPSGQQRVKSSSFGSEEGRSQRVRKGGVIGKSILAVPTLPRGAQPGRTRPAHGLINGLARAAWGGRGGPRGVACLPAPVLPVPSCPVPSHPVGGPMAPPEPRSPGGAG